VLDFFKTVGLSASVLPLALAIIVVAAGLTALGPPPPSARTALSRCCGSYCAPPIDGRETHNCVHHHQAPKQPRMRAPSPNARHRAARHGGV
jgi:hypothetical protein